MYSTVHRDAAAGQYLHGGKGGRDDVGDEKTSEVEQKEF